MNRLSIYLKSILVIFLLFSIALPAGALASYRGDSITVAQGLPETLDPAKVRFTTDFGIVAQIYEGLVEYNPVKGIVEPCLADSWKASEDGLTYTFKLKEGVRFHDGRELTAKDVKYSIQRFVAYSYLDYIQELFSGASQFRAGKTKELSGVKAVDKYSVSIKLNKPVGFLIPAMASILISPERKAGEEDWNKPAGTGPFKLAEYAAGRYILLKRNDDYHITGLPYLDSVMLRLNDQNSSGEFTRGLIASADLPYSDASAWMTHPSYRSYVQIDREVGVHYISLNTSKAPLNNRLVRQALNYLLNISAMGLEEGVEFTRLPGILSPDMPGYLSSLQPYTFDVAKARQLLAQAGYTDLRKFPTITLLCSTPWLKADFDVIWGENLKAAGINYKSVLVSQDQYDKQIESGDYIAAAGAWAPDYMDPDAMFYALMHPNSKNRTGYKDSKLTAMIDKARYTMDPKDRESQYNEMQEYIWRQAPVVFGWSEINYFALDPDLVNWVKHPAAELPLLKYVWSDRPRFDYSTTDLSSAPPSYREALKALKDKNFTKARQLLIETRINFPEMRNEATSLGIVIALAQVSAAESVIKDLVPGKGNANPDVLESFASPPVFDVNSEEEFLNIPRKGKITVPIIAFEVESLPWNDGASLKTVDGIQARLIAEEQSQFVSLLNTVAERPLNTTIRDESITINAAILYRLIAEESARMGFNPAYVSWLYGQAIAYASENPSLEKELKAEREKYRKEMGINE